MKVIIIFSLFLALVSLGTVSGSEYFVGGHTPLNEQELKSAEEDLAKSLSILAAGEGPSYTIDEVYSGTSQIILGTYVHLDADLIDSKTGEKNRCMVSLWSRPWLKKDAYILYFDCKDMPSFNRRHSRSVDK